MLACPAARGGLSSTYSSSNAGHATAPNEIISSHLGFSGRRELSQDSNSRFRANSITSHIFGDVTGSWDSKASRGQCRSDMTKCGHSGVSGEVVWLFNWLVVQLASPGIFNNGVLPTNSYISQVLCNSATASAGYFEALISEILPQFLSAGPV